MNIGKRHPTPPILPPRRAVRLATAAVATAAAALVLSACGGGGDSSGADSTSAATDDVEVLSMPAADFSVMLEDEKVPVLKQAMTATAACDDNQYSYDYLLMVSTDAATTKQDLTLGDLVEDNCT
jgi:hypothetical protein